MKEQWETPPTRAFVTTILWTQTLSVQVFATVLGIANTLCRLDRVLKVHLVKKRFHGRVRKKFFLNAYIP